MSLFDMDTEIINSLPADRLKNAVEGYLIAALEAAGWEPLGRVHPVQIMGRGDRTVQITVVVP